MSNKCGILFTWSDFKDVTGCLKNNAHNDAHVCQNEAGVFIQWEDDYKCTCGCWDEDDLTEVCKVYQKLDSAPLSIIH